MNVTTKRLLSLLVVMAMILPMIPAITLPAAAEAEHAATDAIAAGQAITCPVHGAIAADQWQAADASFSNSGASYTGGHYYLTADQSDNRKHVVTIAADTTVCIHLNGYNMTSAATVNNPTTIKVEGNLTIMGEGTISTPNAGTYSTGGTGAVAVVGGTANLYGGTYHAGSGKTALLSYGAGGQMNLYDGVTVTKGRITQYGQGDAAGEINVYGGSYQTIYYAATACDAEKLNIVAGSFTGDPTAYVAQGSSVVQLGDSSWVVDRAENVRYCTHCKKTVAGWQKLMDADTTITLSADGHYYLGEDLKANLSGNVLTTGSDLDICLDLNGHSIINEGTTAGSYAILANANLAIMGSGTVSGYGSGFHGGAVYTTSNVEKTINLYGGTYTTSKGARGISVGANGGTLNIYAGVTTTKMIQMRGSNENQRSVLNIYGGNLGNVGVTDNCSLIDINISGGAFSGNALVTGYSTISGSGTMNITGGDFSAATIIYGTENTNTVPVISGGTFSIDPTDYVAPNFGAQKNGDVWTVVQNNASAQSMKVYTTDNNQRLNTTVYGLENVTSLRIKFYDAADKLLVEVYNSPENEYMTGAAREKLNVSAMIVGDSGSWNQKGAFEASKLPVKAELYLNGANTPILTSTVIYAGETGETQLTAEKWAQTLKLANNGGMAHPFAVADAIYCEHCQQFVDKAQWTAIASISESDLTASTSSLTTGHYYLANDVTYSSSSSLIGASTGEKLCVHLNGYTILNEAGPAIRGYCTWAIMGEGNVFGNRNHGWYGGAIYGHTTKARSKMYLYGGTYDDLSGDTVVSNNSGGGVIEIHEGVTIKGNIAIRANNEEETSSTLTILGGTVEGYIRMIGVFEKHNVTISGGTFNQSSGLIYEDASESSGSCTINISGGTFYADASPSEDSGGLWNLTSGAGNAIPVITGGTFRTNIGDLLANGYCVERQDGGWQKVVQAEHKQTNIIGSSTNICANCSKLFGDAIEGMTAVLGNDTVVYYADVSSAVANATEGTYVKVPGNCTITLNNANAYIDAAGCEVKLEGTGTIYPMDSANDLYTNYGTWIVDEGVTLVRDVENPVNGYRYITVNKTATIANTYRIEMNLNKITLRPSTADDQMGIYYKAQISCDDALAMEIGTHGVVLSLNDMPGANFLEESDNGFTAIEETLGVSSENGYTVETHSGAVFGIMKSGNSPEDNAARGEMKIYANAYIAIDTDNDGIDEIFVADTATGNEDDVAWSLLDVMEAIEAKWDSYAAVQANVVAFYKHWAPLGMRAWEAKLPKIAAAAAL